LTNKCAKYLFWSKNRFRVWFGDNLKFLESEITKNYMIFDAWGKFFDWIVEIETLSGFYNNFDGIIKELLDISLELLFRLLIVLPWVTVLLRVDGV
jgi:hypothetical protein